MDLGALEAADRILLSLDRGGSGAIVKAEKDRTQAISFTVVSALLLFMLNTAVSTLFDHGYRAIFVGICIATAVVVVVTVLAWFSRHPGEPSIPSRVNFTWIIVFEAAAMGAGNSYVLDNHYPGEWMVAWSALVVGVHFLLMGWSYRRTAYYVIGLILMAAAGVGAAIGDGGNVHLMVAVVLTVLFGTLTVGVVTSFLRSISSR
ncbi:DUF7010 family protein [Nocardia transvalensis]|uniref:DUF7010 family protein n=1 Tax=Nocardia transvalensis TaxID=37333 RepID=UPI0018935CF4|nr:hypothetical protein [Nocardia transvalensis]MBF6334016.1 hypothetical protein [Nocardia transvalensis]